MKTPPFSTLTLCALFPIFAWAEPGGDKELVDPEIDIAPLLAPEKSIAVLPAEVSINGDSQPVLGRSIADSLLGGLVAQGYPKVISYEELLKAKAPDAPEGAPPEALAGMLGRKLGVQTILVPRLIGEGDFYRFTVKEVDTGNYEVLRVFELSHAGDRDGIFGFVPLVLNELEKETETAEGATPPGPAIRIWTWEEYQRDFGVEQEGGFAPSAAPNEIANSTGTPPPASTKGAEAPERIEAVKRGRAVAQMVALGKVSSVNEKWGFCVIDMTGRKLKTSEKVEIREEDSDRVYATLVVTYIDGDKAIADLAADHRQKPISPGAVVFGPDTR